LPTLKMGVTVAQSTAVAEKCSMRALVPRTRSSHIHGARPIANFGFNRGTRAISLPVSFRFRSSHESVPQWVASFGIGTLMLSVLAALMLLMRPALADDESDRRDIVGTWRLVSVVYEDAETKERTPVLGEHPKGRQIATADGRWLALVTAEGRKVPTNDAERARALTSMIAYTGRYRIEGGKVITKVEAAWKEAWVGGEQPTVILCQ